MNYTNDAVNTAFRRAYTGTRQYLDNARAEQARLLDAEPAYHEHVGEALDADIAIHEAVISTLNDVLRDIIMHTAHENGRVISITNAEETARKILEGEK